MKIYYVFTSAGLKTSSVQQKVLNQIKSLKKYGVDCKGLFFTTDNVNDEHDDFQFISVPKIKKGWFRSFRQRRAIHKTLLNWFNKNRPEFDYIYCRYPGASFELAKWLKTYRKKIFIEHVTSETYEIKLYRKENPLRFNLSSWLGNLEFYYLPLLSEWLYGRIIRANAAFGISNSEDIAEYENKRAKRNYNLLIGGDSVKVSDFQIRTIATEPKRLHLLFLKGASTIADFNGLDRVIKGIANYKGDWNIKLYIFGKSLENEIKLAMDLRISDKVIAGGYIEKKDLDKLIGQIDLGLGAFGIFRKGLKSTTIIKAREYFARGLPYIYGHNDPDISGHNELKNCCLELPCDDSDIDFNVVVEWYSQIKDLNATAEFMRQYAIENLDYDVKMRRLINFLITYNRSNTNNS